MKDSDSSRVALYLIGEALDELPQDTHLYHLDLHKLLYLLQARLDDENCIAEQLPFYWYRHGPVSQAAFNAEREATRRGIADVEETEDGKIYTPGPQQPPTPSIDTESPEDLSVAVDKLNDLIEEYRFHEERETLLQEDIYVDAPYRFQPEFKFNALPAAHEFASEGTYSPEELVDDLYRAEGKLPLDDAFSSYNSLFSRFVSLSDTFLSHGTSDDPLLKAQFAELAEVSWRVFCNQLRCETVDDDHSEDLESWEQKAEQSLGTYRQSLDDFEERLHEQDLFEHDAGRVQEGEPWAVIAKSILNES
jgi:uncharacterized phage-associated protein